MFGFYPVVDGQRHDILKEEIREITGALTKPRKSIGWPINLHSQGMHFKKTCFVQRVEVRRERELEQRKGRQNTRRRCDGLNLATCRWFARGPEPSAWEPQGRWPHLTSPVLLLRQPHGLQRFKKRGRRKTLAELSCLATGPGPLKSEVKEAEGGVETDPQIQVSWAAEGEEGAGVGQRCHYATSMLSLEESPKDLDWSANVSAQASSSSKLSEFTAALPLKTQAEPLLTVAMILAFLHLRLGLGDTLFIPAQIP